MQENFIEFLYSKFLQSDGISIDTRTIEPDNLFFALKGPNFNANKYAQQALDAGAAFAVIDDPEYNTDARMILADDAQEALTELAIFHRSRYKRKMIAITGSNGKTTTKELVSRVLNQKYITHATKGNLNNHLGVPLTLLGIHPQVEAAVIEMGANHVGEIAELCRIASPEHGLITNIGEAHTETFGGIEGVLRGKTELFEHLRKTGGTPLINVADERLKHMVKRFDNVVTFPAEDLKLVSADPYIIISLGGKEVKTHLIGAYNFGNIAAAVAVGRTFSISDDQILEAISSYIPENKRSQIIKRDGRQIIVDCYNANPTSMKAALENLSGMSGTQAVILGDMKEVENSQQKHQEVGEQVAQMNVSKAVFIGDAMKAAHELVKNSVWFENGDAFKAEKNLNFQEDNILIKASNSMKLDQLTDLI